MKFNQLINLSILLTATSGALQDCVITNNCDTNIHCMAYCAGVPDPSPQQVAQTERCISLCNSGPAGNVQTACNENCIIANFQSFPNTTFTAGPARTLVPVSYSNSNRFGNDGLEIHSQGFALITCISVGLSMLISSL